MATKRRVKKNIKQDALVTTAIRAGQWAQDHFNQVIVGVVVLVALIAVLVFTANSRQNAARQSERQLGAAMALFQQGDLEASKTAFEQLIQHHSGKNAVIARYFKAECDYRAQNYQQAIAEYDAYLAGADAYPEFEIAARIGKAMCLEGMENYPAAAAELASLVDELPESDPRYITSAYRAGEFFAKAGNDEQAVTYYRLVSEKGTGTMKDRATVALALLDR